MITLEDITINKTELVEQGIRIVSNTPFSPDYIKHEEQGISFLEAHLLCSIIKKLEGDNKKLLLAHYEAIYDKLYVSLCEMHNDGKARNNTMLEGIIYRLALTLGRVDFYSQLVKEELIVKDRFTSQNWNKKRKTCYDHIQFTMTQEELNLFTKDVIFPKILKALEPQEQEEQEQEESV